MSRRANWTSAVLFTQEDDAFLAIIEEVGILHWSLIAYRLNSDYGIAGKSGKQCRERWINHLNPSISKTPWSEQEENELVFYQNVYGNRWSKIAKKISGRSENAIKNHFYSRLRKKIRKFNKFNKFYQKSPVSENLTDVLSDKELVARLMNFSKKNHLAAQESSVLRQESFRTKSELDEFGKERDAEQWVFCPANPSTAVKIPEGLVGAGMVPGIWAVVYAQMPVVPSYPVYYPCPPSGGFYCYPPFQ